MAEVSVEDRVLIRDLYDRMYWAFNRGDGEGFKACMAPGAFMERYDGSVTTVDQTAEGVVKGMDDPVRRTWQHHVTNLFVDPGPDGNESQRAVHLYFLITWVEEAPAIKVRWSCYSHDVVEKIDGEWKIKQRRVELNDTRTA